MLKFSLLKGVNRASLEAFFIGAGLMVGASLVLLSLITYNPVLLVESGDELGAASKALAYFADFLLQYIGFASYFLILTLIRWGFLVFYHANTAYLFNGYAKKVAALIGAVVLLSFLLGSIKRYEFAFTTLLGGYMGFLMSDSTSELPFFFALYALASVMFFWVGGYAFQLHNSAVYRAIVAKIFTKFRRKKPEVQAKKARAGAGEIAARPQTTGARMQKIAVKEPERELKYLPPNSSLLALNNQENAKKNQKNLANTKSLERELSKALNDFGIEAEIKGSRVGPVITMYEVEPKAGIRAARVIGLADDIARALKAKSARISMIPGNSSLAVEIPNIERETVFFRELIESDEYKDNNFSIPICLGKNIVGDNVVVDLATMPHLLVAGTTGSGKSVGVNSMILSILYRLSPMDCQFIMVDPKMLELSVYNDIPHLLTPVVTEPEKAVMALKWLTMEMERRYRAMAGYSVRNIANYNEAVAARRAEMERAGQDAAGVKALEKMPFIVVIIDEMADLMITAGKMIEGYVQRLAQMARAAGIHVIMATQRPSVDVITGVIKANFPTRISYQVTSKIDSRTILGMQGAEALLGKGDMLYMPAGGKTYRIHAPFVSDGEVNNIVAFLKRNYAQSYKDIKVNIFEDMLAEDSGEDSSSGGFSAGGSEPGEKQLYNEAVRIVREENKPSISYIQRRLKIGYNKAANLIERMEAEGIVTKPDPSGKRMVAKQ